MNHNDPRKREILPLERDPQLMLCRGDRFAQEEMPYLQCWAEEFELSERERAVRLGIVRRIRQQLDFLEGVIVAVNSGDLNYAAVANSPKIRLAYRNLERLVNQSDVASVLNGNRQKIDQLLGEDTDAHILPAEHIDRDRYSEEIILAATELLVQNLVLFAEEAMLKGDGDYERVERVCDFFRDKVELQRMLEIKKAESEIGAASTMRFGLGLMMASGEAIESVYSDLCSLVQNYPKLLKIILGNGESNEEILFMQGNILNLMLLSSVELAADQNDELEKKALSGFYGHLPEELQWDAETFVMHAKIEAAVKKIRSAEERKVMNACLKALSGRRFFSARRLRKIPLEDWEKFAELCGQVFRDADEMDDAVDAGKCFEKSINI